MHIKEAYERRIKLESSPLHKSKPTDHSSVIGSLHTGQINYHKNQPFFIDFVVRDEVRQAKNYINTFKDSDLLGLKSQKQWNQSVLPPRKFSDFEREESHKTKLLKIKLGFSDFSPLKQKQNKIYEGTETRDLYTGWNVSTFLDKKEKNDGIQLANLSALDNTINYNKSKLSNYKTLSQRYRQTRDEQKSELMNSSDIIENLKQQCQFTNPNWSLEKTNASVHRMLKQIKIEKIKESIKKQNETPQMRKGRFRANLSPTQKANITYVYYHTGRWERHASQTGGSDQSEAQGGQDEGYAWSCCLNEAKDAVGCSYRIKDRNKMNLSSINHA